MELESAEVLCQLKKTLSRTKRSAPNHENNEECKTQDAVQGFTQPTKVEPDDSINQSTVDNSTQLPNVDPPRNMNYNHYGIQQAQSRFPAPTHMNHHQTQHYQPLSVFFDEKQIRFNQKKRLFDLTVLMKGQWQTIGSFQTHQDAVVAVKCLKTLVATLGPSQNVPSHNMPSAAVPPAMDHESTTVVYTLPTQKVIQLIHRLPSINLSDPWQLTQLVCLYLCLFARISIKMLCSLRESHVNVNTTGSMNGSLKAGEPSKPFVTVVGGRPMCMKHLKCMCSEAHDICNVLCVVTVLTLYQNQKNDSGSQENQVFVRGIALAPNGISRCLTQTPLRETNKLQLAQWLKKITAKFTH